MSTQVSPLSSYRGSSTALDRRGWNLALCFQEIFTATVRLKYRQQNVPSADSFRAQMKQALHAAEQDALARGYKIDDIRRVIFAVVAFLDESVLSCRHPAFADWPRLPLQAELYGNQLAGETFFEELQKVLTRGDSPEVADVLEVFYLCLLLGFQGRYAAGGRGDLHSIKGSIREKMRRIRGPGTALSPRGGIPADAVRVAQSDKLVRKLMIGSWILIFLTAALFLVFKFVLMNNIAQISG
jgi:type VI secretion system protein ImpK